MEKEIIWINGRVMGFKDAKVHVLTHSLHYASGVFEGIRFYKTDNGIAIFRVKEHIDRLFRGAFAMGMKTRYSKLEAINAVKELVKLSRLKSYKSGYIRPLFYYGSGAMQVVPKKLPTNLAIALWPLKSYLKVKNVRVVISKYIRLNPNSTEINMKLSGNYVNSILAGLEARKSGYDEALLLDSKGFIAEGSAENIFFVSNNTLITPNLRSILPGITRDSIIEIAEDIGFVVKEIDIKPGDLKNFSESFFCGTATEITPIKQIGNIRFKIGELTKKIKSEFLSVVYGKNKRYRKWLSYVIKK